MFRLLERSGIRKEKQMSSRTLMLRHIFMINAF